MKRKETSYVDGGHQLIMSIGVFSTTLHIRVPINYYLGIPLTALYSVSYSITSTSYYMAHM